MITKIMPLVLVGSGLGAISVLATSPSEQTLGQYSTSLDGRTHNQRHNAVQALAEVKGIWVKAGETFSFNQHVRGWTKDMGYRQAPVSYNGQLVSSWGGGVCQTSTTLYNAALLSGMEIIERNRHHFAPSYVPPGRDAAVAYENIDLRFRNPFPFSVRIMGEMVADRLTIRIVSKNRAEQPRRVYEEVREVRAPLLFTVKGSQSRVRNSGKSGYEVLVWRDWGNRQELVSQDDYPAMNRILEVR